MSLSLLTKSKQTAQETVWVAVQNISITTAKANYIFFPLHKDITLKKKIL